MQYFNIITVYNLFLGIIKVHIHGKVVATTKRRMVLN